ncbi:Predicted PurR-regulated permease PerM [Amycolatopsis pretoriensis]|uniref:Predicted PurR-regulated permease PerM n=1 Tax=Amycolatopsis pretoriensis TaxID=218821 RepID=A0A1H5Q0V3_9PSEU|nr:AI-2E family transporter [Amycolatopsis pretoriensis]SEF19579.1 Predicted PurR-regulated permease PerM [Amycolatopsis pretoriensis]
MHAPKGRGAYRAGHAVGEAEGAATRQEKPLGTPGKPLDRRSPFFAGLTAAAGVVVTVAIVEVVLAASDVLLLIGIAFFIAVGLEPVTARLTRRMPRALAAGVVVVTGLAVFAAAVAGAAVPLSDQIGQLRDGAPHFLALLRDPGTLIGRANETFGLEAALRGIHLTDVAKSVAGVLGDAAIVVVLSTYFVADFPRVRTALYRLAPRSRRPRVILIGDAVFRKVGAYLVGNVVVSLIAGVLTFAWLWCFGVPYPLVLALLVAVLDLVPVAGSVAAGIGTTLVALTVSVPAGLSTAGFFVGYRVLEDYVLLPKIVGRAVRIPALVTVVAVLIGFELLGVVGAFVAVPVAAAVLLVLREVAVHRLDRT